MRSTSGQHFAGLDHIRALAAFLVVVWHFAHGPDGYPVPFNQAPELAMFDEGHVGVSLFMTLSGYLFAKLIAGRSIHYGAFLWNRALRLLPLLLVVLLIVGIRDYRDRPLTFFNFVVGGAVFPQLPNGGWSITAEAHFYLILPLLLWASARLRWAPIAIVAVAVLGRFLFLAPGGVQESAYWTIIGRFDQFALGIFFASRNVSGLAAAAALVAIVTIYTAFDFAGGFYNGPDWPWIFMTTLEGATFGTIIAWYDAHPIRSPKMWLVTKAGDYSYAIYLLHFFVVFAAAEFVDQHIMRLDSLYAALPWAILFFLAMIGVGHLSYKFIEGPPMRFRRSYIKSDKLCPIEVAPA